jgi:putative DNA primase/helicase
MRPLTAVVTSPTLLPDGTILDQAGYDASTGLLLLPDGDVPIVPACPPLDQAVGAVGELLEVVVDFPFASDAHRSGWVAALLTRFARHAILGDVPLFAVDANSAGAGKGKLVDACEIIANGRPIPRTPQPRDDDELRKQITAIAIAGAPAVLIDNVTGKFAYRSLDAALTCNGYWAERILGRSERREWPLRTVWFLTANNASLSSDTLRRSLPIRLD